MVAESCTILSTAIDTTLLSLTKTNTAKVENELFLTSSFISYLSNQN